MMEKFWPIYFTQAEYDFLLTCSPRTKAWAEEGLANGTIDIYDVYKETFKEKVRGWFRGNRNR